MQVYRVCRANRDSRANQELRARPGIQAPKETEGCLESAVFQDKLDRREMLEGMGFQVCLAGLVYQVMQGYQDLAVYQDWRDCREHQVFLVKMDSLVGQE